MAKTLFFTKLYKILKTKNKKEINNIIDSDDIEINYNNKYFLFYYIYKNYFSLFGKSYKHKITIYIKN